MSYVINGCFKGKAFMSSNKKQGFSGMSVMFARLVLCILLVLNAFVFIYYGVINRSNVLEDESLRMEMSSPPVAAMLRINSMRRALLFMQLSPLM